MPRGAKNMWHLRRQTISEEGGGMTTNASFILSSLRTRPKGAPPPQSAVGFQTWHAWCGINRAFSCSWFIPSCPLTTYPCTPARLAFLRGTDFENIANATPKNLTSRHSILHSVSWGSCPPHGPSPLMRTPKP